MESWGYISGLLRAERIYALSDGFFASLAEAPDADACAKTLEDTIYGPLFQGKNLKDFTPVFDEFFTRKLAELRASAPCPLLFDLYALKTDLNNLKLLYKAKGAQKEVSWESLSESGTILPERMFAIVQDELYNFLPEMVKDALLNLSYNQGDARRVDFLLDKAYYGVRLALLKDAASGSSDYLPLYNLYRKEIDCENIKNLLRAKRMEMGRELLADLLIPGGMLAPEVYLEQANLSAEDTAEMVKEGAYGPALAAGINEWAGSRSVSLLEKQIDEYLLGQVKEFSYIMSGPAVVEETLRILAIEQKNLKLIIIGKLNEMSVESIKGRVRNVGQ